MRKKLTEAELERKRETTRQWKRRNRERVAEYQRAYFRSDPIYHRRYYRSHRMIIGQQALARYYEKKIAMVSAVNPNAPELEQIKLRATECRENAARYKATRGNSK